MKAARQMSRAPPISYPHRAIRFVRKFLMSEFIPKTNGIKIGGLSRKAQKLQSAREKAAQIDTGAKPQPTQSVASFKARDSFANTKKTSFQRKAV